MCGQRFGMRCTVLAWQTQDKPRRCIGCGSTPTRMALATRVATPPSIRVCDRWSADRRLTLPPAAVMVGAPGRQGVPTMEAASPQPADYWKEQIERALLSPVRAMRREYLPLLMVYFAYGAMGLTAVAEAFWIKKGLTWTPAELSALAVWLTLPWTIKMVFGELVDTVPLLGSQRRAYVFVGAGMVGLSFIGLSGAAGGWITIMRPDQLYIAASLLAVTGLVLQDVVADAMSTEVVPRTNRDGSPRAKADIDHDLGMVQVLGRLALGFGIFAVAGLSGWLAQWLSYSTVFLLGLIVPLISISGALLVHLETTEQRPTDWRILGGGIAFGIG